MKQSVTLLPQSPESIITLPEMAKHLKRSPKTIWRWWAVDQVFPKPLINKNGRCLGWKESTYKAWLEERAGV